MINKFKAHASQAHKILGRIGLTEKQEDALIKLREKKRTDLQEEEFQKLLEIKTTRPLPDTFTTHLKEFYAELKEQINTPPVNKGNVCEYETIQLLAEVLNEPLAEKNLNPPKEDEYMIGTCDVELPEFIDDVKTVWSKKTLNDKADNGIEMEYAIQGQVYMHLYGKNKFILFYGLVDTPEEVNYGMEVSYEQWPINERWIAYQIDYDQSIIDLIIERVKIGRKWLEEYDAKMKATLGKIITTT